jgi:signal transduction histidine kinase/ActR/RegA family two-component response regulator
LAAAASGELVTSEAKVLDRNGKPRNIYTSYRIIADRSGAEHVLSVTEDITERKRTEAVRQEALSAAEAANQAKTSFLTTISHEIRTPLNGVLGMAQAMARDELTEVQRGRLDVVRQSGETLLAILNDVLDLSKIEAGRLELEAIDFDLEEVVTGAAASFSAVAAAKGLALVTDTASAAGLYHGDPTRLRQIISNLISNAVKFTDSGSVRVIARHDGSDLLLTVTDTGVGMSPEVIGRLFETFAQADASTTRRFGGTGMGLAICRQLAELMGGGVRAESRCGEGSSFIVTVPIVRVGEAGPTRSERPDSVLPAGDLRILAAEDNGVNRKVLQTILEQAGLGVTLVSNGAEAVAAYRLQAWDLILMDVQMPVMDGVEATRAIRAFEQETGRGHTPVIALTANAMQHQQAEYLASGMDRCVAKPLQIAELFAAIEALAGGESDASRLAG